MLMSRLEKEFIVLNVNFFFFEAGAKSLTRNKDPYLKRRLKLKSVKKKRASYSSRFINQEAQLSLACFKSLPMSTIST